LCSLKGRSSSSLSSVPIGSFLVSSFDFILFLPVFFWLRRMLSFPPCSAGGGFFWHFSFGLRRYSFFSFLSVFSFFPNAGPPGARMAAPGFFRILSSVVPCTFGLRTSKVSSESLFVWRLPASLVIFYRYSPTAFRWDFVFLFQRLLCFLTLTLSSPAAASLLFSGTAPVLLRVYGDPLFFTRLICVFLFPCHPFLTLEQNTFFRTRGPFVIYH